MEDRHWRDPDEDGLRGALERLTVNRRRFAEAGMEAEATLFNVMQFAVLFNFDLRCLQQDVVGAGNTWRAKLYARYLALIMYEASDDFMALLGTRLRTVLQTWNAPPELFRRLNALHGQVSQMRRENATLFGRIRNVVGGHRDHDADLQIDLIASIDPVDVVQESLRFLAWMTDLHQFCSEIMDWEGARQHP